MSRESRLLKNTAIIAIGNICTKCISFLMLPLYTSILSTDEYGTVDLINTYVTLLIIILTLQFEQGLFRSLIEYRGDNKEQKEYLSTAFFSVLSINIIFCIIMIPALSLLNYKYTLYLVLWSVIGALNALILQVPRGFGNNAIYATGSFISGSSNVILNVLFIAVLRYGIIGMLSANIISQGLSAIYITLRLKLWRTIIITEIDKDCFKELRNYSFPLIPYTLCWWIINASDRQIINIFLGTSANGIYSISNKFPSIFSLVTGIFQTAWTESVAENVNDSDRDSFYHGMVNKTIRFYSSGNIGIIAAIPLVFSFLVKNDFTDAYNYIPILMTAVLFHSVTSLYGSIYFAFKETKKVAWTTALAAVINIVVNVACIKWIGLYAAAISTLVAYIVVFMIRQHDIQKYTHINLDKKYLLCELLLYIIVYISYYSRNWWLQIIVFILLFPYCFYQNKGILLPLFRKGISIIKSKR